MSAAALILGVGILVALCIYRGRRLRAAERERDSIRDTASNAFDLLVQADDRADRLRDDLEHTRAECRAARRERGEARTAATCEAHIRAHILRNWPREQTERFALHLLGDEAQAWWAARTSGDAGPTGTEPVRAWLDRTLAGDEA